MARYLQVSSDIAERVAAGVLAGGDELPSIRQAAQRYDTTATTIGRAWRHLADAGVIEVTDRRRACVAAGVRPRPGGCSAATRRCAWRAAMTPAWTSRCAAPGHPSSPWAPAAASTA